MCNFQLNITVVEISSRMAYVASKWFGLKLDNYHSLVIADGVSFIEEEVKKGLSMHYINSVITICFHSVVDR